MFKTCLANCNRLTNNSFFHFLYIINTPTRVLLRLTSNSSLMFSPSFRDNTTKVNVLTYFFIINTLYFSTPNAQEVM